VSRQPPVPEPPPRHGWRAWPGRVGAAVWRILTVSPLLTAAIAIALLYALTNRSAVSLRSLEGKEDERLALRLGHELDDVARGAQTGTNVDMTLRRAAAAVPGLSVPGTNVTVDVLLKLFQWGPLRETEIRAALVPEGQGSQRTYRMLLYMEGPNLSARAIETEALPTEQAALTAGAEALYEVLKPSAAAYYFFSRDPDRSLRLVDQILKRQHGPDDDRTSAYHVWGLVLRDRGDYPAALARMRDAVDSAERADFFPDRPRLARIRVDQGYVHLLDGNLQGAARAFSAAAADDPGWALPRLLAADASRTMGRLDQARGLYEQARGTAPDAVEPWVGLGHVSRDQADYAGAIDALLVARRLARAPDTRAALSDEVSELFAALCCDARASREHDRLVCEPPPGWWVSAGSPERAGRSAECPP
jgi:tetratricopeptide (TPR) repeat protein